MFLKCYHILHPMEKFGPMVDMQIDEKNSLDIFEMFVGTSEPMKEVVNKDNYKCLRGFKWMSRTLNVFKVVSET